MRTKVLIVAVIAAAGTVIGLHVGDCPMKGHCMKSTKTEVVHKN
jgi:hypothetical protein